MRIYAMLVGKPRRIKRALCAAFALLVVIGCCVWGGGGGRALSAMNPHTGIPVPILMYHSVLKNPAAAGPYVLSPDVFRQDMSYLQEQGYTSIFVSQLTDYVYGRGTLPEKPVIVTFDDGYLNNLAYILPILQELQVKAVISIVGAYSQTFSEASDPNLNYAHLTWDDIRTLADSGLVEIGNHTYQMHTIGARRGCMKRDGESDDQYRQALLSDVGKLQTILQEQSGVCPQVFAYPYGFISPQSTSILQELGFMAALTSDEHINYIGSDPAVLFRLGRFNRPAGLSTSTFMKRLTAAD